MSSISCTTHLTNGHSPVLSLEHVPVPCMPCDGDEDRDDPDPTDSSRDVPGSECGSHVRPAFTQAGTERHLITTESLLSGSALLTWGQGILWVGEQPPWSPGAGSQPAEPLRGQMCPRRAWGGRHIGAGQEEVRGGEAGATKQLLHRAILGRQLPSGAYILAARGGGMRVMTQKLLLPRPLQETPETQQSIRPSKVRALPKVLSQEWNVRSICCRTL